jgi:predicted  nucleic acid-binding Zn-ribbon protein
MNWYKYSQKHQYTAQDMETVNRRYETGQRNSLYLQQQLLRLTSNIKNVQTQIQQQQELVNNNVSTPEILNRLNSQLSLLQQQQQIAQKQLTDINNSNEYYKAMIDNQFDRPQAAAQKDQKSIWDILAEDNSGNPFSIWEKWLKQRQQKQTDQVYSR